MDSQLEIKLIECLSRLDDGEPIDRILAYYPADAASLRPLLETAVALEGLHTAPRESARIASRRAFLAQAYELRESVSQRSWLPRRLAILIAALVAAFIFVSGTVAASESALPSEPLYGVKRAIENAQLLVAAGAGKEQLAASFGQRRRDEINLLLVMRRDTAIAFEGMIERMQPNGWEVSGLFVSFDQATTIAGTPVVGSSVRIYGHTQAGRLLADSISIDPGSSPIPGTTATTTAKPSATARPSATAIPSPSPQPKATQPPRATSQSEATEQPAARPTTTPTLAPTATSTAAPRLRPTPAPTALPPTSGPNTAGPPTSEPPPAAPPVDAQPTAVPPINAQPTAAPPTPGSDHSGPGGGSDNGGGDPGGGDGDHGGGDHGGGGDPGGGGGTDRP